MEKSKIVVGGTRKGRKPRRKVLFLRVIDCRLFRLEVKLQGRARSIGQQLELALSTPEESSSVSVDQSAEKSSTLEASPEKSDSVDPAVGPIRQYGAYNRTWYFWDKGESQ